MNNFIQFSHGEKINITYLAIGSAFSSSGGPQQHPPFMEKLISGHPELIFEIIIMDPLIENPPEIVKYYDLVLVGPERYEKNNLIVNVINEKFFFDFPTSSSRDAHDSRNLLYSLIDRTISFKSENPTETFLLFVHDFSGYSINKLSDIVWEDYQKSSNIIKYLYKKNILIDLNNKIDASCFVDLKSSYFHPELVVNSYGSNEIFNPFFLEDFDIYTIAIQKYCSPNIKKLLLHAIMYRLKYFSDNILSSYRQHRILHSKEIISPQDKTTKMLSELQSITGYLDFFSGSTRVKIFGDFFDFCEKATMENPYELTKKFDSCQKKLEVFLLNLDPIEHFSHLNDLTVDYIVKNNKLPLFMELLLQNK